MLHFTAYRLFKVILSNFQRTDFVELVLSERFRPYDYVRPRLY